MSHTLHPGDWPRHYVNQLYGSNTVGDVLREPQENTPEYMNRFAYIIPALTLPLLKYMVQWQPDMAVVCERGARPIGRGIEELIEATGDERLASIPFRYYKVSGSLELDVASTATHLQPLMDEIRERNSERVMGIDDILQQGKARGQFVQTCQDTHVSPDVKWTTLGGGGADFVAWPFLGVLTLIPWLDKPEYIGVDYTPTLQRVPVETETAAQFAAAIRKGAQALAQAQPMAQLLAA